MILNNSKRISGNINFYGPDDVIDKQKADMTDLGGGSTYSPSGSSSGISYTTSGGYTNGGASSGSMRAALDAINAEDSANSGYGYTGSSNQQFPVGLYDYGNTTPMYQLGSGEVNAASPDFSWKDMFKFDPKQAAIGKGVGALAGMAGIPFGSTMYKGIKMAYDRNKETGAKLRSDLKERGFTDAEAESAIKTYYSNLSAKNDANAANGTDGKDAPVGQAAPVATGPAPATQQQPRGMTNLGMFTIGNEAPPLVTKPKKISDAQRTLTLGNMINGGA